MVPYIMAEEALVLFLAVPIHDCTVETVKPSACHPLQPPSLPSNEEIVSSKLIILQFEASENSI
jgi:hypothetical protein